MTDDTVKSDDIAKLIREARSLVKIFCIEEDGVIPQLANALEKSEAENKQIRSMCGIVKDQVMPLLAHVIFVHHSPTDELNSESNSVIEILAGHLPDNGDSHD